MSPRFLVLFALITTFLPGCGEEPINLSNPQHVGEAFCNALCAKDYEEAVKHVLPEDRESFETQLLKELGRLPPLPEVPEVRVNVDIKNSSGEVFIDNWEFDDGIDMTYADGRWYVSK